MTRATRRRRPPLPMLLGLGLIMAACSATAAPNASPSATASPSPATTTVPSQAQASPTAIAVATASPTPVVSVAPCQPLPREGILPSDRFTALRVDRGDTADRLTFAFGNPSLPGGPTPPQGLLAVARPPYTQAGSGAAIRMAGEHVLELRFTGMSLANDVGQPTYDGPTELTPSFEALKQAVQFDASEGVVGWYIGYDGVGCVALGRAGSDVTITIAHAP